MPNYRQSQFKIETPKDVEQDGEINTLTNSLNNLVIPPSVNWSTETASQNVDMGLHDITNATNIYALSLRVNGATLSTIAGRFRCNLPFNCAGDIVAQNYGTEGSFYNNGLQALICNSTMTVNKTANLISSNTNASISGINEITCNAVNPTIINLGANKDIKIEAQGSQFTVTGYGYFTNYIASGEEITAPIGTYNKAYLGTENIAYPATLVVDGTTNTITSNRNASISGINEITCNKLNYTELSPAIPTPDKSLLTYYVDGSCGSDTNDGSREHPFKTIQSAINKCELVWDGTAREIKVGFGSYVENLTISKARIQLTGSVCSRYANVACGINGIITLQIADAVDMFNSQVFITGFQIVGSVIDASSSVHTLNIKDCYLYGQENIIQQKTRGPVILNPINGLPTNNYTAVNCRTYLENLTISASNGLGTTPLVSFEAGNLEMTSCNITAKSANTNCITILNNASTSTFTSSNFTNDNTGSALKSLVYLTNIAGSPTFNSFVNCGFIFGSTTSKTVDVNNGNNTAIYTYERDDYFNILRCTFALQGVSATTTNYIIMPAYPTSGNMFLSQSGNVSSIGTAYKIATSGVTSYPFTVVS